MSYRWARALLLFVSTAAALVAIALLAEAVSRPAANPLILSAKSGTGLGMLRLALEYLRRLARGPVPRKSR
jgi:ABC-type Fe3+-siderophore transport system permease subunit